MSEKERKFPDQEPATYPWTAILARHVEALDKAIDYKIEHNYEQLVIKLILQRGINSMSEEEFIELCEIEQESMEEQIKAHLAKSAKEAPKEGARS